MQSPASQPASLYDAFALAVFNYSEDPREPPPDTIFTATIETIDNDRAYSLLNAVPRI